VGYPDNPQQTCQMEIKRILKLEPLLAMKSFFLFGPRATGKTTLIKQELAKKATIIDLLDSRYFLRLSNAPHELESIISLPKKF
jgi:predicted AAA+ superfamily ATPase